MWLGPALDLEQRWQLLLTAYHNNGIGSSFGTCQALCAASALKYKDSLENRRSKNRASSALQLVSALPPAAAR